MAMLRTLMLSAASSAALRGVAERSRVISPVVHRFVAGPTEADALQRTRELLDARLVVTLDYLGEAITTLEQADRTVLAYQSLLGALSSSGMADRAEVSVKLSAIGQALPNDGEKVALDRARDICQAAAAARTTVTLDMEDHTTTDSTLTILSELRKDFPWVGAVLQAYLRRTESDCRDLAAAGSRVRLCKGAYREPESVAFRGPAVAESYRRCLRVLLGGDCYPMIATHDPAMIAAAQALIASYGRAADSYEFQMLYGVRPAAQRAMVANGVRLRVYLPYGGQWYGYFMRRLAERPANLTFFLRALHSRS